MKTTWSSLGIGIRFVEGKDCSEYAEDVIEQTGGDLITFIAVKDIDKFPAPFVIYDAPAFEQETYFYHTIASTPFGIIDCTSSYEVFANYEFITSQAEGDFDFFIVVKGNWQFEMKPIPELIQAFHRQGLEYTFYNRQGLVIQVEGLNSEQPTDMFK